MPYDIKLEVSFENFLKNNGEKFSQADAEILRNLPTPIKYNLMEAIQEDNTRCDSCERGDCSDCDDHYDRIKYEKQLQRIDSILDVACCRDCNFLDIVKSEPSQVAHCNCQLSISTTIADLSHMPAWCPLIKLKKSMEK